MTAFKVIPAIPAISDIPDIPAIPTIRAIPALIVIHTIYACTAHIVMKHDRCTILLAGIIVCACPIVILRAQDVYIYIWIKFYLCLGRCSLLYVSVHGSIEFSTWMLFSPMTASWLWADSADIVMNLSRWLSWVSLSVGWHITNVVAASLNWQIYNYVLHKVSVLQWDYSHQVCGRIHFTNSGIWHRPSIVALSVKIKSSRDGIDWIQHPVTIEWSRKLYPWGIYSYFSCWTNLAVQNTQRGRDIMVYHYWHNLRSWFQTHELIGPGWSKSYSCQSAF